MDKVYQDKVCYILRGVSGSGKSTLASLLSGHNPGKVFEADQYMMKDGEYVWAADKLQKAHGDCFLDFHESCQVGVSPLVVSNTNTTEKEFKKYFDTASEKGYSVFSLVVENRHGGESIHDVPSETLSRQKQRLESSIKLV